MKQSIQIAPNCVLQLWGIEEIKGITKLTDGFYVTFFGGSRKTLKYGDWLTQGEDGKWYVETAEDHKKIFLHSLFS